MWSCKSKWLALRALIRMAQGTDPPGRRGSLSEWWCSFISLFLCQCVSEDTEGKQRILFPSTRLSDRSIEAWRHLGLLFGPIHRCPECWAGCLVYLGIFTSSLGWIRQNSSSNSTFVCSAASSTTREKKQKRKKNVWVCVGVLENLSLTTWP